MTELDVWCLPPFSPSSSLRSSSASANAKTTPAVFERKLNLLLSSPPSYYSEYPSEKKHLVAAQIISEKRRRPPPSEREMPPLPPVIEIAAADNDSFSSVNSETAALFTSAVAKNRSFLQEGKGSQMDPLELADLGLGHEYLAKRSRSPFSWDSLRARKKIPTQRPRWSNNLQFLFASLSFSFGIRSLIDVPLNIFLHGRGAFIIIYIALMAFVTCPLLQVHILLGQFYQGGMLTVWFCSPVAGGIGISMLIGCILYCIYNSASMGHAVYYLYLCTFENLPWSNCQVEWGAQNDCIDAKAEIEEQTSFFSSNLSRSCLGSSCPSPKLDFPSIQLWKNHVHGDAEFLKWEMVVASLLPWILVYICTMKSITVYKHLAIPMTLIPFGILIALIVKVSTSMDSAALFDLFQMSPEEFSDASVWSAAAKSAFSDALLLSGVLISLASFQGRESRIHFQANVIVVVVVLCHLGSYLFVFGLFAHNDRLNLASVMGVDGVDVAFGIMPDLMLALKERVWAVLYFVMILIFELGTIIVLVESVLSSMEDMSKRSTKFRFIWAALFNVAIFLIALLFLSNMGNALYKGCVAFLEPNLVGTITVAWLIFLFVYGSDRISEEYCKMTGYQPNGRVLLGLLVFLFLVVASFLGLFQFGDAKWSRANLAVWAYDIGLGLFLATILPIVACPVYNAVKLSLEGCSSLEVFKIKTILTSGQMSTTAKEDSTKRVLKYSRRSSMPRRMGNQAMEHVDLDSDYITI